MRSTRSIRHVRASAGLSALLGGTKPSYIGQVATRAVLPNNTASFGATNQMNARSRHIMRASTNAIAIVLPTWRYNSGPLQDVALGGTATVTASIEYPVNTFTQITWGGATSKVLPDFSNTISDFMTISIPVGAVFFIRVFWQSANGFINQTNIVGPQTTQACRDELNGERYAQAASGLTDLTLGGTITSTNENVGFSPTAIVGRTSSPSVLLFGDSRCEGAYDIYNDASTNIGCLGRAIGPYFPFINIGGFGDGAHNFSTAGHSARRIELAQFCSHIASEMGINDLSNGSRTPAQLATIDLPNCWALLNAAGGQPKRVIQCTLPPITTSTDSWTTTTNQTKMVQEASRLTFNGLVRAILAGTVGSMDIASVAESSLNSGFWRIDTITSQFTASQTTTTMNVSAVASGTLAVNDIVLAINGTAAARTAIDAFAGGSGGTGNYTMQPSQSVASTSFIANPAASDGIHEGPKLNDLYRTAGVFNPALIHYP